ncbi:radical SAM family heme chaperone HemW [Motiliproteus coralliicola]|uniref:Heme chaperone HemW n=1 Tax=Motiliproteus coralliicola TaxID=2283196 RepID=A0A369WE00_9GAMM|nr:radical SAM family heme chaperone HemW [Motiliproteus coralliicola]RDE18924.1 radical SAM family heme chaperone HemW [Motiliproteus coralliicola]
MALISGASTGLQLPPLSLYIHVPWCVRKCPYCDFNSHAQRGEIPQADYLQALLDDLDAELNWVQGRTLQSIFIGGGTPSLMEATFYQQLLEQIEQRIPFADGIEITLEANPGTFEQARFAGYREAGINRLSLGIQSFDDGCLQALGRIHSGAEAEQAVAQAQAIGFERLNLDLMHGLPGQTPTMALADLERAIGLGTTHLSWYQLTIEPNTEFHSRPPRLPEDEALWAIQEQGQARLSEAGFEQYEISGYCKVGQQCRHNLNYWRFGDYLGIGAGAHAKLSDPLTERGGQIGRLVRRWKARQPKAYLAGLNRAEQRVIEADELALEFMMNALRLSDGVEAQLFEQRTGLPLATIEPQLTRARSLGLLEQDPALLRPTLQGRRFLNELLELFV